MALGAQVVAVVWAKSRIESLEKKGFSLLISPWRLLGLLGQIEEEESMAPWCADRLGSSAGPEIPWECAGQLLSVTCPGPSWLFLTPGLRQRETSGRTGVSVGLGIVNQCWSLGCLLACHHIQELPDCRFVSQGGFVRPLGFCFFVVVIKAPLYP